MSSTESINSIQKACRILSCFNVDNVSCSLNDLCERTGFAKSTVFRICDILIREGFLAKTEEGTRYFPTEKLLTIGLAASNSSDYRAIIREYMTELSAEIDVSVCIYVETEDMDKLCVDGVESSSEVRVVTPVGRSFPLYLGASGRILLADMHADKLELYLAKLSDNPPADLPQTVAELRAEIEDARKRGYAVTYGERVPDTISIATSIPYINGQKAALLVSAPGNRLYGNNMLHALEALQDTAEAIRERLH